LVGIEPVSNFILLEQYAERRDADTWDCCLDERLTSLPVTVLQVTSDEALRTKHYTYKCALLFLYKHALNESGEEGGQNNGRAHF